jgi:hypothetical protein
MKRAAIVTVVWLLYGALYGFLAISVLPAAKLTEPAAQVENMTLGVGLFGLPWLLATPLLGLMWVIVVFRWVLGGEPQAPARVEQFRPPPPPPAREQYTITGRRLY